MFNVFGMTIDDFNAYVEECKKLGYTVDPGEFDGFYSADDAEGYNGYLCTCSWPHFCKNPYRQKFPYQQLIFFA